MYGTFLFYSSQVLVYIQVTITVSYIISKHLRNNICLLVIFIHQINSKLKLFKPRIKALRKYNSVSGNSNYKRTYNI